MVGRPMTRPLHGRFAAERRAGRRRRSTVAAAGRPTGAVPQHGAHQQIALGSQTRAVIISNK